MEPSASHLLSAVGPRAAEAALVGELERLLPHSLEEHARRPGPLRVVVPSGSLRIHLLAELAQRRKAWLGLEVLTLRRLALSLFERAGERPPRGGTLLPVLVRRAALREPELATPLAPLEGGFAPLVATVRDLLDAGLEAAHGRPLAELVADSALRIALADRPRAAAVLRVAARVARDLDRQGAGAGAALYRLAAELAQHRPELLPGAERWFVHGFADATGSALDLLQALLRLAPTTLVFDSPESATGEPRSAEDPYGAAFRLRLVEPLRSSAVAAPAPGRAALDAFSARGEEAEAREVARRIRAALAADPMLRPESIGIVARDLAPYLGPLRRACERAALPCSVHGVGAASPAAPEVAALIHLLDRRGAAAIDLAVDLVAPGLGGTFAAAEIRVAFGRLGVATLADLANLDDAQLPDLKLPLRQVAFDAEGEASLRSRRLPRGQLARWLGRGRALLDAVERLPDRGAAHRLLKAHLTLARRALPAEGAAGLWLAEALAHLAADLPEEFPLGRDELAELLAREAESLTSPAAEGRGGGVQILSVTAARGRTFELLHLIGLRRGLFPRPLAEDPLLPDGVRRQLQTLLPDLPVKADGHAEERFHFDQLLAAAPAVVLSYPALSDDGAERIVSPLLDRLSWRDEATRALRDAWRRTPVEPAEPAVDLPAPPGELARRAGLARDRPAWLAALPAAIAEARHAATVAAADRTLAAYRGALLDEIDLDPRTPRGRRRWSELGPFFGRVGGLAAERLFVTRVERLVACAWLDFLTRRLGIEPLPDPGDALPDPLDPLRLGNATHRLLQELVEEAMGERRRTDGEWMVAGDEPRPLRFPAPDRVERKAREIAAACLAEEGLARWGFDELLTGALLERAAVAREDWGDARRVVGVELEGVADLTPFGVPLGLAFRADRVERESGRTILTDYKTGRVKGVADLAPDGALARAIAAGRALQPAVYVAAFAGRPATGRLLALAPADDEPPERVAVLDERAVGALASLARVAGIADGARAAGRFTPRLIDPSGEEQGPLCRDCELLEACVQGDSGALRRLARWAERARAARPDGGSASPGDVEARLFLLPETGDDGGSA